MSTESDYTSGSYSDKDLAHWIDRLSLICEDIHIEETYNI